MSNTNYPIGDQRCEEISKKDIYGEKYVDSVITIHDIKGYIVKKYEGKYWITQSSEHKVVFEDENNHRHMILISTGSIIIDQKG